MKKGPIIQLDQIAAHTEMPGVSIVGKNDKTEVIFKILLSHHFSFVRSVQSWAGGQFAGSNGNGENVFKTYANQPPCRSLLFFTSTVSAKFRKVQFIMKNRHDDATDASQD